VMNREILGIAVIVDRSPFFVPCPWSALLCHCPWLSTPMTRLCTLRLTMRIFSPDRVEPIPAFPQVLSRIIGVSDFRFRFTVAGGRRLTFFQAAKERPSPKIPF